MCTNGVSGSIDPKSNPAMVAGAAGPSAITQATGGGDAARRTAAPVTGTDMSGLQAIVDALQAVITQLTDLVAQLGNGSILGGGAGAAALESNGNAPDVGVELPMPGEAAIGRRDVMAEIADGTYAANVRRFLDEDLGVLQADAVADDGTAAQVTLPSPGGTDDTSVSRAEIDAYVAGAKGALPADAMTFDDAVAAARSRIRDLGDSGTLTDVGRWDSDMTKLVTTALNEGRVDELRALQPELQAAAAAQAQHLQREAAGIPDAEARTIQGALRLDSLGARVNELTMFVAGGIDRHLVHLITAQRYEDGRQTGKSALAEAYAHAVSPPEAQAVVTGVMGPDGTLVPAGNSDVLVGAPELRGLSDDAMLFVRALASGGGSSFPIANIAELGEIWKGLPADEQAHVRDWVGGGGKIDGTPLLELLSIAPPPGLGPDGAEPRNVGYALSVRDLQVTQVTQFVRSIVDGADVDEAVQAAGPQRLDPDADWRADLIAAGSSMGSGPPQVWV